MIYDTALPVKLNFYILYEKKKSCLFESYFLFIYWYFIVLLFLFQIIYFQGVL